MKLDTKTNPDAPIDIFTMVVLRRRIEAVIRDMVNTLFRTGRSGVLNTAMDFSCSITDDQLREAVAVMDDALSSL